jgi:hypothetical protein
MEATHGSAVTRKSHLSLSDKTEKAKVIMLRGDFSQTVTHVKRGLTQQIAVREVFTLRLLRRSHC